MGSVVKPKIISAIKKSNRISRVLVTGGNGQLGTEMLPYLYELYGEENVLSTDNFPTKNPNCKNFEVLNVLERNKVESLIRLFKPDYIIHFAAILSANGERNPKLCLSVNIDGFKNILDIACENKISLHQEVTQYPDMIRVKYKYSAPNLSLVRYNCGLKPIFLLFQDLTYISDFLFDECF